jgi:Na+/H+ antiporter NhaD/arsenite permease-like protein
VFFIFIVSNAGGSLTPLGDPPLFLGFLKGVDFFWTISHILPETLFLCTSLLAILYAIDRWYFSHEPLRAVDPTPEHKEGFHLLGTPNLLLLGAIVALVLMSGLWKSDLSWRIAGVDVGLPQFVRDLALIGVCVASLMLTPRAVRAANQFEWGPMLEVAKLFAGIFITIVPVLAMLKAGDQGAFASVVQLVSGTQGEPLPGMYFWASGLLSSFLDNAPTYLAFFNLASGDPQVLMGPLAPVLAAISAGSVFMGANSYIGNAPNLMVKAIAESRGVRMPSFFGYMAWSCGILLPLFAIITLIWF